MPLDESKGLGTSGTLSQLSRQASTDDVKARVRRSSMTAERMLVHQKSFALEEEKVKREAGLHDARWSTMFPSLGRQMAKSNSKLALFLISPLSPRLAVWDIVTGIALIFTLISTPYEVGFLPSPKHANEPLFIANRLIDVIFILDMVKEFFLCVPADRVARAEEALAKAVSKSIAENKPTALAKAQKELEDSMMHLQDFETDMGEIAKRYLRGWFTVDVLSIAPSLVDIIPVIAAQEDSSSGPSGVKVMRTLRALRLIKLLRLIRASRVLARLEVRVSTPRLTVTIIKLAVTSIAFGHMLGCVLGMLSAFSSPLDAWTATFGYCSPFDTSQGMADHSESFVVIDDVLPGEKSYVCVSPSALYFQSLWWALALISGASNEPSAGPLRPYYASSSSSGGTRFTLVEQIMQTVIILFGIFYFTIVTGVFVEAISSSDPDLTEYRQGMDDLNRCISHFNLPRQTAMQLRLYHRECKEKFRAEKRLAVLDRLSPKLNEQVTWEVNKGWLIGCPCFMYVSDQLYLVRVAQSVQSAVFVPHEQPPPRRLYIIQTGSVFYKGQSLSSNDSWGSDDVLLTGQDDRNRKRALTASYVHANYVDQQAFSNLKDEFPYAYSRTRLWAMFNAVGHYILAHYREQRKQAVMDVLHKQMRASCAALRFTQKLKKMHTKVKLTPWEKLSQRVGALQLGGRNTEPTTDVAKFLLDERKGYLAKGQYVAGGKMPPVKALPEHGPTKWPYQEKKPPLEALKARVSELERLVAASIKEISADISNVEASQRDDNKLFA